MRFLQYRKQLRNSIGFLLPQCLLTIKELDKTGLPASKKMELFAKACDLQLNEEPLTIKQEKEPLNVIKNLRLLSYFCKTWKEEDLLAITLGLHPNQELKSLFQKQIADTYAISSLSEEEVYESYEKTFGSLRVPYALEIYTVAIREINEMQAPLKRFVETVLLGTFAEERYRIDNNPHLQKIQEEAPEVFQKWKEISFEKTLEGDFQKEMTNFKYREFFLEKLQDGHFNLEGIDKLPMLTHFLRTGEKKDIEGEDKDLALVQNLCISLIENGEVETEDQKKMLIEIELALQNHSLEILNDVRVLLKKEKNPNGVKAEKIILTRDMEDLFLTGTESGSCQRVDGNGEYNKCLLAYCLDGKVSLLACKDRGGKIVGRSIVRLLWDSKTGKPALFLSRYYGESELQEEVVQAALECAKLLGCKVYVNGVDDKLDSLGTSAPYEYVDEAGGITRGVYTVSAEEITAKE